MTGCNLSLSLVYKIYELKLLRKCLSYQYTFYAAILFDDFFGLAISFSAKSFFFLSNLFLPFFLFTSDF